MSKLAKFFMICAAVCVLGIVMTFAGYAAGGIDDMQKVADKHEWLNIGPNATETETVSVGDFKSIEAEGNLDIAIVSVGRDLEDMDTPEFIEDMYSEGVEGTVVINWIKGESIPDITNENGVLKIKGTKENMEYVVNFSGDDPVPDAVVFCSADELENINITGKYGDITIGGIKSKSITVTAESGDIDLEDVEGGDIAVETEVGDFDISNVDSSKMTLRTNTGDMEISRSTGKIEAETNTGDIDFETDLQQSQYELNLSVSAGAISLNSEEIEAKEFSAEGGPGKLTFKTNTGDIDVDFQED